MWNVAGMRTASKNERSPDVGSLILNRILMGKIQPGQRLSEIGLAKDLGIGLTPLRRELDRLAYRGILERSSRVGTFVREVSVDEFCQLMDLRAALEGMAARLAVGRITDSQLGRLEKLARQLDSPKTRIVQGEPMDEEFHHIILEAAGNSEITRVLEGRLVREKTFLLLVRVSRKRSEYPASPAWVVPHMQIVKSFQGGKALEAEATSRDHVLNSKMTLLARLHGATVL